MGRKWWRRGEGYFRFGTLKKVVDEGKKRKCLSCVLISLA